MHNLFASLILATATVGSAQTATPVPVMPVGDFLNSLGTNVHLLLKASVFPVQDEPSAALCCRRFLHGCEIAKIDFFLPDADTGMPTSFNLPYATNP